MAMMNSTGKKANTIKDSFQLIVQRYANEPIVTNVVIKKFSGPWWASSLTSKRSFVILVISCPVSLLS